MKRKACIVGGTGYTGSELIRLLLNHPDVQLTVVTSRSMAGSPLSDVHPALEGLTELSFEQPRPESLDVDIVFLAVPHGEAAPLATEMLRHNPSIKIVDLSADFRLPRDTYESVYATKHVCPELLKTRTLGIPELYREELMGASLVANPGCFANCIMLSLAPFAQAKCIEPHVKVSAVTGSSGGGALPKTTSHHPWRNESLWAYGVLSHRHTPEIQGVLSRLSEETFNISFVPQSGPFTRGILSVSFIELRKDVDPVEIVSLFAERNPFLRFREDSPNVKTVRGSNFCDIAVEQLGNEVVVLSALDNLVKGASGNAVQCMNLMLGLEETAGLLHGPLTP